MTLEEAERAIRALPFAKAVTTEYGRDRRSVNIELITDNSGYTISASVPPDSYLGCISFDPNGGGGNDLHDGTLTAAVLDELCWDIECYDALVGGSPLQKTQRHNRWSG